ncbi:MFS transporter [Streptomyces sp. M19]
MSRFAIQRRTGNGDPEKSHHVPSISLTRGIRQSGSPPDRHGQFHRNGDRVVRLRPVRSRLGPGLRPLFFPDSSAVAGTLASFAIFAVAFFVRPIGGLVAAHIGDRVGRKPVLIFTVTLMGAATVAVGFLPTYDVIGVWAPVLLALTRVLQGWAREPSSPAR